MVDQYQHDEHVKFFDVYQYLKRNQVYLDTGVWGWLKSTAIAEHWRVAGWYSADDLFQDGFICYCKCRDRYTMRYPDPGDRPDGFAHQNLFTKTPSESQRKHFMNLLQRTFHNHIYTLALRYPATREEPVSALTVGESDDPVTMEELMASEPEGISALVAVLHAPTEIADAIVKLVNDGIDGGKYLRSRLRVSPDGKRVRTVRRAIRETTPEHMARILGDPELPAKTLAYILS